MMSADCEPAAGREIWDHKWARPRPGPEVDAGSRKKLRTETKRDQNWRGKKLYLKFAFGNWIWGIEAFEDDPETIMGGNYPVPVVVPKAVCDEGFLDHDFPIGNAFFKFNGKAYLAGGETTGGRRFGFDHLKPTKESDKLYEFDTVTFTLNPLSQLALPCPMPRPEFAEINGNIYLLYGDHCTGGAGTPADPEKSFVVLELDGNGKLRWRVLPPPPFYDKSISHFCRCRKHILGVIGDKLYVRAKLVVYVFDAGTEKWELGSYRSNAVARTLKPSLSLMMNDTRQDLFLVVSANIDLTCVYAALVDCKTGKYLKHQKIPEALLHKDLHVYCCQVVQIEDDDDAGPLSRTVCFVYLTFDNLVGVSVLRIYSDDAGGKGLLPFKIEVLISRVYQKPANDRLLCGFDAFFL